MLNMCTNCLPRNEAIATGVFAKIWHGWSFKRNGAGGFSTNSIDASGPLFSPTPSPYPRPVAMAGSSAVDRHLASETVRLRPSGSAENKHSSPPGPELPLRKRGKRKVQGGTKGNTWLWTELFGHCCMSQDNLG